jgi:sucrose phosphorylase
MDLLTVAQRRALAEVVESNGGRIKYKATPAGREPYELCCSTRDSLRPLEDERLEVRRYLSFYTLAFALMGCNVKSVYFNDLIALPNDHRRLARTGELRDLKRTKSDFDRLANLIEDPATFEYTIARGMNDLIALVDGDPALHFRGREAEMLTPLSQSTPEAVAVVHCSRGPDHTVVVVNVSAEAQSVVIDAAAAGFTPGGSLYDNIEGLELAPAANGALSLTLEPFQRMWLTSTEVPIDRERLFAAG